MKTIKILATGNASTTSNLLKEIINSQPDMELVGTAPDPFLAYELCKQWKPDVLILEESILKKDKLEFLEIILRLSPVPVVMISSITEQASDFTFRLQELDVVNAFTNSRMDIRLTRQENPENISDRIRGAVRKNLHCSPTISLAGSLITPRLNADAVLPSITNQITSTEKLIILGASTGGTEAIKEFLTKLPRGCPGILIAQHMPETFTLSFANRLNSLCQISVKEAQHGDIVLPGHAYIAPGHSHLMLRRSGASYICELNQGPPVNRHRPSVDVLFRSAANTAGSNAIGVILTGMGKDGAAGMLEMRKAGAYNFAQDEASCVVFGMPKEAIAIGGVDEVVALQEMAPRIIKYLSSLGTKATST